MFCRIINHEVKITTIKYIFMQKWTAENKNLKISNDSVCGNTKIFTFSVDE